MPKKTATPTSAKPKPQTSSLSSISDRKNKFKAGADLTSKIK